MRQDTNKNRPVYYMQTDPKWANLDYSAKGEHTTIGRAGCGPTCAAMVAATLKDKKVTPKTTAAWALKHGYKAAGQGTYYSYFAAQGKVYGIDIKMVNLTNLYSMEQAKRKEYDLKAKTAVKDGNLVIACMGPGLWTHGGHYILWYDMEGDQVLINDPASKEAKRLNAPWKTLRDQVKYYFICKSARGTRSL